MPEAVVRIFISHISEEQVEATRAKEYLEAVFPKRIKVFIASSWTSIAPGEDWFQKIQDAIQNADIMLVLASGALCANVLETPTPFEFSVEGGEAEDHGVAEGVGLRG